MTEIRNTQLHKLRVYILLSSTISIYFLQYYMASASEVKV